MDYYIFCLVYNNTCNTCTILALALAQAVHPVYNITVSGTRYTRGAARARLAAYVHYFADLLARTIKVGGCRQSVFLIGCDFYVVFANAIASRVMQLTAVLFVLAFAGLAVAYPMPSRGWAGEQAYRRPYGDEYPAEQAEAMRNYGYEKPTDNQKSMFEEYFEAQSAPAPSSKQSAPGMAWPFGISPDRDEEGEMAEIPNKVGGDIQSFQELARMNSFPYAQMQAPADEERMGTNIMEGAKMNYYGHVEEEEEEEEEEGNGGKVVGQEAFDQFMDNFLSNTDTDNGMDKAEEEEEEEGNGGKVVGQEAFNQFMDNFLSNTDTDNVVDEAEEDGTTTGDKQAMGYWQQDGNDNGNGDQEWGKGGGQAMGFWGRDEGNMFAQARPQPAQVDSMPEGDVNEYFREMQRASYQQAEAQDHLGPSRLQNYGELRDFADSQNGPSMTGDDWQGQGGGQRWGRGREVETQDVSED